MDDFFTTEMRGYIMATEPLLDQDEMSELEMITESVSPLGAPHLISDLQDVIFKLRAFTESSDGDFALGVEMGMQRAADMIENAIRRHTEGEQPLG